MVEKAPGVLLVWTYKTIPTDQRERMIEDVKKIDPEQSIRYQLYHHETILWELDCHAKLIRAEEFIDFDKDGKVLKRHRNPPTEWTPIFPKTGGEALYRKVCLPQKETIKKKRR
jgi:hypothetical protein